MRKHNNGWVNYEFTTTFRSKWWICTSNILVDNKMSVN